MSIQPVSTSDAERRASRIRLRLDNVADSHEANLDRFRRILGEIKESVEQYGDHIELGYPSHTKYVEDRFGGALNRLGIEHRREAVGVLSDMQMSTRAIAAVTGTNQSTIVRDRQSGDASASPEPPLTDEPGRVTKLTGPGAVDPHVNTETGEVSDDYEPKGLSEEQTPDEGTHETRTPKGVNQAHALGEEGRETPTPESARPAVIGRDGKTYTPRTQSKPRRKSLPDSFFTATYDLGKRIESVHRLTEDDRFPQNAEKVATAHRNDLLRYRDLLEQVINRLPEA